MTERERLIGALVALQREYNDMHAVCACLSAFIAFLIIEREDALMEHCAPLMLHLSRVITSQYN